MKHYTASEIVERSLRLADIHNTDFLTYEEKEQYLQDSWKTIYQWLINKGDKQFVKELELVNSYSMGDWTEYILPLDLYQICSLKNKNSGSVINRHSESQGINSNTYEVVNNRLRLYGVVDQPLLLTYWVNPLYLSFPNRTIQIASIGNILSTAGSYALTDDGIIHNLLTEEEVGSITITDGHNYTLGNGHILDSYNTTITYLDFNGNQLYTANKSNSVLTTYLDSNYNLYYQLDKGTPRFFGNKKYEAEVDAQFIMATDNYLIEGTDGNTIKLYSVEDCSYIAEVELPFVAGGSYIPVEQFDGFDSFLITDHYNNVYLALIDSDYSIRFEKLSIKDPIILGLINYGIITYNGSTLNIVSRIPDTVLNFPNDLYVSLLACDLALSYAMKQNIDASGLNALYTNMQYQFVNSLEQDGGYNRIQNSYR